MKYEFLSTKDRKVIDNRRMAYTYYYNDIKNEWEYEDEIIHMNGYRIITFEK